jgi:hypothetical protein
MNEPSSADITKGLELWEARPEPEKPKPEAPPLPAVLRGKDGRLLKRQPIPCLACGQLFRPAHVERSKFCSQRCLGVYTMRNRPEYHGQCFTSEYRIWQGMKERCQNQKRPEFKNYGGRGITFCERWKDFKNFFSDMGQKPTPKHTLERINNNGNYEPSNCKWATRKEQLNNKRDNVFIECEGIRLTITQWSERVGIHVATIKHRLAKQWSIQKALRTPPDQTKNHYGRTA